MIVIDDLMQTRLAILTLSQAAGWLTTIGAGETEMLAFVLPRTAPVATIRLGLVIACHKHDETVGAGNYHLFRLKNPVEERFSRSLTSFQNRVLPHGALETAIPYLNQLTEGMAIDSQPGPVRMGLYSDLTNNPTGTLACLAKHYLLAYQMGHQTFPYFS